MDPATLCLRLSWLLIPCLDRGYTIHCHQVASALDCYPKGIQPLQHNCGANQETISVELSGTATLASGRRLNGNAWSRYLENRLTRKRLRLHDILLLRGHNIPARGRCHRYRYVDIARVRELAAFLSTSHSSYERFPCRSMQWCLSYPMKIASRVPVAYR